jgi:hypothetical protein
MAKRSTIKTQVPRPIQDEFNARLVAGGFADYEGLTEWLNERLAEEGLSVRISKTSAFRYGAEFQEQFERDMAEQRQLYQIAKTSLADNQDPEGVVREATIRTMQTRLLRISIALRDAEEAGDDPHLLAETSSKIAKAIADLGRMDIQSQKYKHEVEVQIKREALEAAAERVSEAAKAQGLDVDQARFWREKVLMGV